MNQLLAIAFAVQMLLGTACYAQPLPTAEPKDVGMTEKVLGNIELDVRKMIDDRHLTGCVVMIARRGKVIYCEPFGSMHVEREVRMRRNAIFRIYSMTKAITTAAALTLVDDGRLAIDAPVSQYLPELANLKVYVDGVEHPAEQTMTVADLMRHTAGFTYGFQGNAGVEQLYKSVEIMNYDSDLELVVKKFGQLPLVFEPGQNWKYSMSIDVLGRVIEMVAEKSLGEFLQERIFTPLGMVDTGFYVPADKVDRFTANYMADLTGRMVICDEPTKSGYVRQRRFESGGGGLVSTADDYMRFLVMVAGGGELFGKRILSPESVELMTTNQLPENVQWIRWGDEVSTGVGFGFGFAVQSEPHESDPDRRIGEYGWGGAASTHYWTSPRDELIVITLEQTMPYNSQTEDRIKPIVYEAIAGDD